jgi:hypothetical protein
MVDSFRSGPPVWDTHPARSGDAVSPRDPEPTPYARFAEPLNFPESVYVTFTGSMVPVSSGNSAHSNVSESAAFGTGPAALSPGTTSVEWRKWT